MKPTTVSKLNSLTPEEKKDLLPLVNELLASKQREECQDSFMKFIKNQWTAFIEGPHHKIMAEAFERVARGELKRLIINMPPRHTKSEFASYLLPAWFLGKYPDKRLYNQLIPQNLQ